jgi:Ca-activated chloride channel family protein
VTGLYEIVPIGAEGDLKLGTVDPPRYGKTPAAQQGGAEGAGSGAGSRAAGSANLAGEGRSPGGDELLYVKLRYKDPDGETSRLLEHPVGAAAGAPSEDFRFAAAVAEFGLLLRDSEFKGTSSFDDVIEAAGRATGRDDAGYRAEFVRLAAGARTLAAQKVAANAGN